MRGDENHLVYADAPVTVPFDGQGLPNQRMTWVQNGELQNLDYSGYWADRQGTRPTGFPSGWYMAERSATR
jgi:predicted Zn-dependent protease